MRGSICNSEQTGWARLCGCKYPKLFVLRCCTYSNVPEGPCSVPDWSQSEHSFTCLTLQVIQSTEITLRELRTRHFVRVCSHLSLCFGSQLTVTLQRSFFWALYNRLSVLWSTHLHVTVRSLVLKMLIKSISRHLLYCTHLQIEVHI